MAYETRENTGSLFRDDSADSMNKKPNKTGTCKVNGKLMRVAVWENQKSKDGTKTFDSLKFSEFKPKEDRTSQSSGIDNDIPF